MPPDTPPIVDVIARNVQARRIELGLSIEELAVRSGLSQDIWARIESGKVSGITIAQLQRMARTLQTSAAELLRVGKHMPGSP